MPRSLLLLSRVFVDRAKLGGQQGGKRGKGKGRGKQPGWGWSTQGALPPAGLVEFVRPEDEHYLRRAEWYFAFPCPETGQMLQQELKPFRVVMAIPWKAAKGAVRALGDAF